MRLAQLSSWADIMSKLHISAIRAEASSTAQGSETRGEASLAIEEDSCASVPADAPITEEDSCASMSDGAASCASLILDENSCASM